METSCEINIWASTLRVRVHLYAIYDHLNFPLLLLVHLKAVVSDAAAILHVYAPNYPRFLCGIE